MNQTSFPPRLYGPHIIGEKHIQAIEILPLNIFVIENLIALLRATRRRNEAL